MAEPAFYLPRKCKLKSNLTKHFSPPPPVRRRHLRAGIDGRTRFIRSFSYGDDGGHGGGDQRCSSKKLGQGITANVSLLPEMPRNFSTIGCTSMRICCTALRVSNGMSKYLSLRLVVLGRQCA